MKNSAFNRLGILAGAAAVFALVLTGCFGGGGDDDDESSETTTTTTTAAPAVSVVTPVVPPPVAPPAPTPAPAPVPTTAAPAPAPTTAAPASSLTYTIQPGDTLAAIADRFNVSVDDIVAANSIDNPDVISIGQQLTIPTGGAATGGSTGNGSDSSAAGATGSTSGNTYTVASGDTLAAIANRFNVDLDDLIAVNNIENQDVISVGQVLTIPSS